MANSMKWTVIQIGFCSTIDAVLVRFDCHVELSFRFLIISPVVLVLVCMFTPVIARTPEQINAGIRNTALIIAYDFSDGISFAIDVINIKKDEYVINAYTPYSRIDKSDIILSYPVNVTYDSYCKENYV